jgi:hypothetical protein
MIVLFQNIDLVLICAVVVGAHLAKNLIILKKLRRPAVADRPSAIQRSIQRRRSGFAVDNQGRVASGRSPTNGVLHF